MSTSASGKARPTLRNRFDLLRTVLGPFLALALVFGFFAVADNMQNGSRASFTTVHNLRTICAQTGVVAVAALGMTIVIVSGGIDLSAGTAMALSATVLAWCLKEDIAVYCVYGDNVASANARYQRHHDELERKMNLQRRSGIPSWATQKDIEAEQAQDVALAAHRERVQKQGTQLSWLTPFLAVPVAILVGGLAGFINGLLVSWLRVVPFIVTLGTMTVYLGVAKMISQETTVRPLPSQVPDWLSSVLSVRDEALVAGIPSGVWFTLLLAGLLSLVLRYTVFGRYVYALGSNESTARLCGVNIEWNKIAVYTLAGLFVGVAGVFQFSRLTSGTPTAGSGWELKFIAAVVIGGGSLSGGRGTVLGTLTGAAMMLVISSGCTQLGWSNPVQDIILGVIIVAAVAIDQLRQRHLAS
ncbi:MAG TPA: ABC transporter permease [Planctomycetaceae bacterium]|nr:ABC transporter permease [Planctomycetaceae bacterium]